ncbi:L,D-transpeptidase [Candidatus Microgenomates bacterium]|nr:L,D-transpeptidase [Candidatus Microgenomates bacterium]
MKQYFYSFLIAIYVLAGITLGLPKYSAYLLSSELASDQKVEEIMVQDVQPNPEVASYVFNNQDFVYDYNSEVSQLAQLPPTAQTGDEESAVLGTDDSRWIEINLSQQRLYAWDNGNQIGNYLISSGKWAPTPTGDFRIWTKLASTTMKGGSKALGTYYYLPNVPCTMYFYKGYGLHGTYWHNNFGHPMSHGCVNMRTPDACTIFNWASVGTRVNIHY